MKIGLSSYSLNRAISTGELSWPQAIEWTAQHGGEHFEVVPMGGLNLGQDDSLREAIICQARESGIALSSYTIGANFLAKLPMRRRSSASKVKSKWPQHSASRECVTTLGYAPKKRLLPIALKSTFLDW